MLFINCFISIIEIFIINPMNWTNNLFNRPLIESINKYVVINILAIQSFAIMYIISMNYGYLLLPIMNIIIALVIIFISLLITNYYEFNYCIKQLILHLLIIRIIIGIMYFLIDSLPLLKRFFIHIIYKPGILELGLFLVFLFIFIYLYKNYHKFTLYKLSELIIKGIIRLSLLSIIHNIFLLYDLNNIILFFFALYINNITYYCSSPDNSEFSNTFSKLIKKVDDLNLHKKGINQETSPTSITI
jgi:hypothetical protein